MFDRVISTLRALSTPCIAAGVLTVLWGQANSPNWGGQAWEDHRFPAERLSLGLSNPPAWVAWRGGIKVLEFADEAVNEDEVMGTMQQPHGVVENSDYHNHSHWSLEDDTNCNVRWCIEYIGANVDGLFPAGTTTACTDCASGADADKANQCDMGDIAGGTISRITKFRFYRNSSHANDTCDGKAAYLHEFDPHMQFDRPGSRQENTK